MWTRNRIATASTVAVGTLVAATLVPAALFVATPPAGAAVTTSTPPRTVPATAFPTSVTRITPPAAGGRVLWVSTTGSDYQADGWRERPNSRTTPWRTIRMAIRRARPGDTIVVASGTYVEDAGWGAVPGRPDRRITLQSAPGAYVHLVGTLQLVRADYWTVRGLHLSLGARFSQFVVKFDGGTGWLFEGNEVTAGRGVSNVMVSGLSGSPRSYRLTGNCVHDLHGRSSVPGQRHNLYLMPGLSGGGGRVDHNVLFGAPDGANIKAAGSSASSSPAGVLIDHNSMARSGSGVVVGLATNHVRIERNLIAVRVPDVTSHGFDAGIKGYSLVGAAVSADHNAINGFPYQVRVNEASRTSIRTSATSSVAPYWPAINCRAMTSTAVAAAAFGVTG